VESSDNPASLGPLRASCNGWWRLSKSLDGLELSLSPIFESLQVLTSKTMELKPCLPLKARFHAGRRVRSLIRCYSRKAKILRVRASGPNFFRNDIGLHINQSLHLHIFQRSTFNIHCLLSSMSSSPAQLRAIYRAFLRELPSRGLQSRSPLQERIRTTIASNSATPLEQAEQFLQYVKAQRMYATLLERYNPGMNMDEEERVRLTARRVGMDLPEEYLVPEKNS
jgi:ATP synthase assembly factor FMC1